MMTNWELTQIFFKNHNSSFLCLPEDYIDLDKPYRSIYKTYRVSYNIICYDYTNKLFKSFVPNLYWDNVYISIPAGGLKYYWIFRKKELYKLFKRDERGLLEIYDDLEVFWNKIGKHFKHLFKISVWGRHFTSLNTCNHTYKPKYIESVTYTLNPKYSQTICECIDKLYENMEKEFV